MLIEYGTFSRKVPRKRDMRTDFSFSYFTVESHYFNKFGSFDITCRMEEDSSSGSQGTRGVSRMPPLFIHLTLLKVCDPALPYWRVG